MRCTTCGAASRGEHARAQLAALEPRVRRRVERLLGQVEQMLPRCEQVLRQTRARVLHGITNSDGKLLSLFQPSAQILRRGKPHRPNEFGLLVKVQEADGGIVTDIHVVPGKADAPLLVSSVEHHILTFGAPPRLVATDRGFHSDAGEAAIVKLGVRHAVIPKPGYRSAARIAHERQRWFRRGRAWRAGGEARIGRLKNHFGMRRARYRGENGTERTACWAALSNNLSAQ
jgi:transposase, IS5 family